MTIKRHIKALLCGGDDMLSMGKVMCWIFLCAAISFWARGLDVPEHLNSFFDASLMYAGYMKGAAVYKATRVSPEEE